MEPRDVVVVGGSAGSLAPLRELTAALPPGLPGSVLVTMHVGEHARSRLPWLLSRSGRLPATHAAAGERLQPGRVYVAPPGCHLLMPGGVVELSNGPKVNRTRPAVDVMFASAARWFGDRVVAVVLSGWLDDGAVGAALVTQAGGLVAVQEPDDAAQSSMPLAALAAAPGAITAPAKRLGEVVAGMLGAGGLAAWPRPEQPEDTEVSMEESSDLQFLSPGETRLTRLACPECGGPWLRLSCRRSPITAATWGTSSGRSRWRPPRSKRPRLNCGRLSQRWRRPRRWPGTWSATPILATPPSSRPVPRTGPAGWPSHCGHRLGRVGHMAMWRLLAEGRSDGHGAHHG